MNMNKYRSAALALATCAAGLSLAACSAGITTDSPAASSPAASRSTGSSASSGTTSGSTTLGSTVSVNGPIGSFPIPSGAKVIENISSGKQTVIMLGSVTPQKASSFYTSALPRVGYTITTNATVPVKKDTEVGIQFTGHGYKGVIFATSNLGGSGDMGTSSKNVLEIALTKQ